MKFSLVYPTRDRPRFIETALRFLAKQDHDDFEVIVSDNYTDPSLSCEIFCTNAAVKNVRYIRPPQPLGMVDNWNYALEHASGDYIFFFTDKMFLLPGTLSYVESVLRESPAEILSWVDNKFTPLKFPNYFGEGTYLHSRPEVDIGKRFEAFNPKVELSKKVLAETARGEQSPSHYARGKICFGGYSRNLIKRIQDCSGVLFRNISPDYTSMILALSFANSAIEIDRPGVVHINTDLSNGGQVAIRDDMALSYLNSLGRVDSFFEQTLIPNLYSSVHNNVAHDYISLKRKFNLEYELNYINWLVYITEDLNLPNRIWSTSKIEREHREILEDFIEQNLNSEERKEYMMKLEARRIARDYLNVVKSQDLHPNIGIRGRIRPYVPNFIVNTVRYMREHKLKERQFSTDINLYDLLL